MLHDARYSPQWSKSRDATALCDVFFFESRHPPPSRDRRDAVPLLAILKPVILISNPTKTPEETFVPIPATLASVFFFGYCKDQAMRKACESDSRCGLACDASACDAWSSDASHSAPPRTDQKSDKSKKARIPISQSVLDSLMMQVQSVASLAPLLSM